MAGKAKIFASQIDTEIGLWRNKIAGYAADRVPPMQVGATYESEQEGQSALQQTGVNSDRTKMPRAGGVFSGAVGFENGTCRIITATKICDLLLDSSGAANDKLFGDYDIDLDSGTTGVLTTLQGARIDGQRVRLHGITGNTITITHTAAATDDTILCPQEINFTMKDQEIIDLVYDISVNKWRLVRGHINIIKQDASFIEILDSGAGGEPLINFVIDGVTVAQLDKPNTKFKLFNNYRLDMNAKDILNVGVINSNTVGLFLDPKNLSNSWIFEFPSDGLLDIREAGSSLFTVNAGGFGGVGGAGSTFHFEFPEIASDPAAVLNSALLYAKDVSTVTKLFVRFSDGTVKEIAVV